MAHRYWRIRFFDSPSGGTRNRVYECEMKTTRGGSDVTGSGTPSASSVWSGSAANAFDNDTGTFLEFNEQQSGDLQYDFGAGQDKAIVEITLRTSTANNSPWGLRIEGSDDASTWIVYAHYEDLSWGSNETKTFTLGPMNPKPRITAIAPTSVTVTGTYLDPGATAQESAQWQLEEATGDFSTPLQDTGETTTDKLSHTFSSLTAQTVYRMRVRFKESGASTWGNWGYMWFRTPEFTNCVHDNFNADDLGDWPPTGWTQNPNFSCGGAIEDPEQHYKTLLYSNGLWNSEYEGGKSARIANNATWGQGTHTMYYSGFNQADMRVVGLVNRHNAGALAMIFAARYTPGASVGTGYQVYFDTSGNMRLRRQDTYLGSGADLDSDASPTNWSAMVPRFFLIEVEGSTIRGKYWDVDEAEPASFNWEQTDATYSAAGYPGFDGDSASGIAHVDWVQIEFMTSQVPVQPTVTVDSVGDNGANFSTSAFSGGSGTHKDTRWEVATDAAFANVVHDVTSSVDKTTHAVSGLLGGTDYWVRATFRDDTDQAGLASAGVMFTTNENSGVGDPPELTLGLVGVNTANVSVENDSDYLSVEYRVQQGTTTISSIVKTGTSRFSHQFTGLTASTQYSASARVVRTGGTSPWSTAVVFVTLASEIPAGDLLGCPPLAWGYLWNPDANPVDWSTRKGYGFFTPYAGEPLRGLATCVLRYPSGGQSWDIEISDDLGATYTPLASNVTQTSTDGDGLPTYEFVLDTTGFADGQDYRLKATNEGAVVIESLSFLIDNSNLAYAWSNRERTLDDGRYATLWHTKKGYGVWGGEDPGGLIWRQATNEKSILQHRGGPFSALVDTTVPTSAKGGDITIRMYLWSGEGGFAHQQSRVDLEGWFAGVGFFINGSSDVLLGPLDATGGWRPPSEGTGLFVGLNSDYATALGCCDEFNVSTQGTFLTARAKAALSDGFTFMQNATDPFVNSANMKILERTHGKHAHSIFKYLTAQQKLDFANAPYKWWRDGPVPGEKPNKAQTCARRYEMIVLRVRVELDDADKSKVTIKTRVDHAGVEPPSSGYWHSNTTWVADSPFTEGVLALLGSQHARTTYGAANGNRNFMSYSMLPLNPVTLPDIPAVELPPEIPVTVEGEPCTLVLQAYEEDRENLKWEVGTDRAHVNPYLMEPEFYGEQEIDIVEGRASISQVDVIVIDKAQTPGDQTSGWLTERLVEGGRGVIHGRRFRLIRFISVELGWVVIADGPAGSPRLDQSYAGYRWSIRDTRETERKIQAFLTTRTNHLFPMGVENGFGRSEDPETGEEFWVIEANTPIVGTFQYQYSSPGVPRKGYVDFGSHWSGGYNPLIGGLTPDNQTIDEPRLAITEDVYDAALSTVVTTAGGKPVFYTWPQIEILWRPEGSTGDYNIVKPSDTLVTTQRTAVPRGTTASEIVFYGQNLFRAFTGQKLDTGKDVQRAVRWMNLQGLDEDGTLKTDYTYPTEGQSIEVMVRYIGQVSKALPLHIEFQDITSYLFLPQLPGNYAYTAYDPVMDTTGTLFSVRADIAPNDWTINGVIFSRWSGYTVWYLALRKGGFIELGFYHNPGGFFDAVQSTDPVTFAAGARAWVRADVLMDDGQGNFVIGFFTSGDGLVWSQLGDPITLTGGPITIDNSPADVNIGQPAFGLYAMRGRVYECMIVDDGLIKYDANFTGFPTPVLSFNESGPAALLVTIIQTGSDEIAEMRIGGVPYTTGEFLRDIYDGLYSPRDPVTGGLISSGIRYDESALLQMVDPVRARITETVKDVRKWTEEHIYGPTGWVPALDNDLKISPVSQIPPTDFGSLPVITDVVTEPVPNWNAGETIVNVLTFKYKRLVQVEPEDAESGDLLKEKEIEIVFRDEESILNHGEEPVTYETDAFMANGDTTGSPAVDLTLELGYQLSQERKLYVFDRYKNGAQAVHIPVRRDFSALFRPGTWVVIDLSWIPDYAIQKRGGIYGGQCIAIRDVDCAWRVLLVEEALPVVTS